MPENTLYYGDNLEILRLHVPDESVDLIYLDPPFKSNQDYNVLFAEQNGAQSSAQIKVFEDTWTWNQESMLAYQEIVERGDRISDVIQGFFKFLGTSDMMAYLSMMAPRLIELHRVLKPNGSIYLHCDPTASHYLKILIDAIFKPENLLNEIIWSYKRYTASSNRFQRLHDVIFLYKKGKKNKFNELREEYGEKSGKADSHYKQDEDGRWFRWQKRKGKEPYKVYLSEGRRIGDVWEISIINASAKERLGYPTQKPEALIERIVKASSDENDIILDPFCGCGTSISVAQKLNRKWIGIDITHLAISLIKHRLQDAYGNDIEFETIGEPITLSGAKDLARDDPYQFQWWALGLVGARPVEQKKGADRGIDGKINFFLHSAKDKTPKQIIFSVKAGKVNVTHIRDLRGVIDREEAEIGVYLSLNPPTKPMITESTMAGVYEPFGISGEKYPRLQILTIEELLNGKTIQCPPFARVRNGNVTFKRAPKIEKKKGDKFKNSSLKKFN